MNTRTVKLKALKLNRNENSYWLSARYERETVSQVTELYIPKMLLPIAYDSMPVLTYDEMSVGCVYNQTVDIGFGSLICPGEWEERLIRVKQVDMTIEDIEKALGHKVKIISKEAMYE